MAGVEEENIQYTITMVERDIERMYNLKYVGDPKAPSPHLYKIAMLSKIASKIQDKAVDLEQLELE